MIDDGMDFRSVAHDINGLMAIASLSAEFLSSHEDETVVTQAGRIGRAIDQVVAICSQKLARSDLARQREVLAQEEVDHLLREVADLVSVECTLAERPIDFFVHVSDDVRLITNRAQLFRILFNLALNAANAISRHGGSWIEISAISTGGRVLFDVCDDGPGLPPHILSYLFPDLISGAKPHRGRIGCGLITSVHLASELGGELRLNADNGPGTSFCLILPGEIVAGPARHLSDVVDADFAVA